MRQTERYAQVTRWLELYKARETVIDALRRVPTVGGMPDVRDDPANQRITALMDEIMTELGKPTKTVYYVLYLFDDGDGAPCVQQAVRSDDYLHHCGLFDAANEALVKGMRITPDGDNEYNGVTTMEIRP